MNDCLVDLGYHTTWMPNTKENVKLMHNKLITEYSSSEPWSWEWWFRDWLFYNHDWIWKHEFRGNLESVACYWVCLFNQMWLIDVYHTHKQGDKCLL